MAIQVLKLCWELQENPVKASAVASSCQVGEGQQEPVLCTPRWGSPPRAEAPTPLRSPQSEGSQGMWKKPHFLWFCMRKTLLLC